MKNWGLVVAVIIVLGLLVGLPLYAESSMPKPTSSPSNTHAVNNGLTQVSLLSVPSVSTAIVKNVTIVTVLGVLPPRSIAETMYCIGDYGASQCPPSQNQVAGNSTIFVIGPGVVPPRSTTETLYCIGDLGASQCASFQNQFAENGTSVRVISAEK